MTLRSDEENDNNGNGIGFYTPNTKKLIRHENNNNWKQPKHRTVKFGRKLQPKYKFLKPGLTCPFNWEFCKFS